jgi:mono/diheme cytochrome c family protein
MTKTTWLVIGMSLAACGGGGGDAEEGGGGGTSGGEVAAEFDGPVQSTDVATGQARFDAICGACHPGGNEDIGPTIRGIGWAAGRVRQQARQGRGRMRPVNATRLSNEDLESVLAFLQTIGTVQADAPADAAPPSPTGPDAALPEEAVQ